MEAWQIDTLKNGKIQLIAPNGIVLFEVTPDTAEMLAKMLLDEAASASDDLEEPPFFGIGDGD